MYNFKYYGKKNGKKIIIYFSFRIFENFSRDFLCQNIILFFKKSAELISLNSPNFFLY